MDCERRGGRKAKDDRSVTTSTLSKVCSLSLRDDATKLTCLLTDSFATFEKHFPQLVAIDSHGFQRNKLNFFEREREEMRVLTQASEIAENVWVSLRSSFSHLTETDVTCHSSETRKTYRCRQCRRTARRP